MGWMISNALMKAYENSHSSQEQAAESLAENSSNGAQSAPLSVNPTPLAYLCSDRMTAFSTRSLSGMTFALLTADRGEDLLTWYRAGFLAKTSAQQGRVLELMGKGLDSGGKWRGSFARYSPFTRLWKTHQCSLLGGWEVFSETWPRWGMMQDGECFPLRILEHSTSVNAFGYLPTPRKSGQSRAFKAYKRENYQGNLEEFLGEIGYEGWMNPQFSEIVMKWPVGWTSILPLAMDKFQLWLHQHGKY